MQGCPAGKNSSHHGTFLTALRITSLKAQVPVQACQGEDRPARIMFERKIPMTILKKSLPVAAVLIAAVTLYASSVERYLHVRVSNPRTHELVRVNLPLSLAEKVVPAINHGQLQHGKVQVGDFTTDVDVRAILNALKTAPEGEFVTVQENDSDVRVAKEHGQLVVHVVDKAGKE